MNSNNLSKILVENANECYVLLNDGFEIDYCNQKVKDLTKFDTNELKDMRFRDIIHPDKWESVKSNLSNLNKNCLQITFETTLLNKNYKNIQIQCCIKKIHIDGYDYSLVIIHDISSYKQVEKELELKLKNILSPHYKMDEQEFGAIINKTEIQKIMDDFYELTNIGVAIEDMEGNVLVATGWQDICTKFHRINPKTRENCIESDVHLVQELPKGEFSIYKCKNNMWDIATPIIVGEKRLGTLFLGQFFFSDEDIDYEFFEKQADKYGFDKEKYLKALDEVPRWSKDTIDTVMDFYTRFALLISKLSYSNLKLAKLLEEHKKVEENLRNRKEQVKKALSRSDFYRDLLAHDVANVLNNIKSSVQLIEMYKKDQNKKANQEEFLSIIKDQAEKGIDLISKVQKLSLIEDDKINVRPVNVLDQLEKVISSIKAQFSEETLKIKTDFPRESIEVRGGVLLYDAFENIIINSIKHNENDTIKIWINLSRKRHKGVDYVKIEFIDNGIGIPDKRKKYIFQRNETHERSKTGMGIGLSLVKTIVSSYGGRIEVNNRVEDNYSKGTNFTIFLKEV